MRLRTALTLAVVPAATWLLPWTRVLPRFVPDLPVAVVVMAASVQAGVAPMIAGAALGLVLDAWSAARFGTHALVLVSLAYLTGWLAERVNLGTLALRAPLLFAAGVGAELGIHLVSHAFHGVALAGPGPGWAQRALATMLLGVSLWWLIPAEARES